MEKQLAKLCQGIARLIEGYHVRPSDILFSQHAPEPDFRVLLFGSSVSVVSLVVCLAAVSTDRSLVSTSRVSYSNMNLYTTIQAIR